MAQLNQQKIGNMEIDDNTDLDTDVSWSLKTKRAGTSR
jgi:hypothetical protein